MTCIWHRASDRQPAMGEVVSVRMDCSLSETGFNLLGRCVWHSGIWVNQDTAHWWFDDYTEWAAEADVVGVEDV